MQFEIVFVALFAVATTVALVARWLKVPYTVALVVAGLALGATRALRAPHLTKELLYAVFLPGLLFEAAFHLEFRRFWQNKLAITALAVPGVAVAIALTAALLTPAAHALHVAAGFGVRHALVFAALIAATDPIAVVALFKSLGAPKRLAVLVEGESLLNDGTAVVLFTLILAAATGRPLSVGAAVLEFVRVVGVGLAIGTAIAFAAAVVIQRVDDPMIEITVTTIAAYGSFVAAEQLHYSGVIATVAAGMVCGNYAARTGMSPSTRIAVESFWEYVAFALNSVVFLLIGFEVRLDALLASWPAILAAYAAVTLGRAVVVALVTAALRRSAERIPARWAAVLTWGGLRGGLSMVLVLGLPAAFPHRELLATMTFGVVILSILVQGLTMGPLLRRLGVIDAHAERDAYDLARGRARAARAVLAALEWLGRDGSLDADATRELAKRYTQTAADADAEVRALHLRAADLRTEARYAATRQVLLIEKAAIHEAFRTGLVGQHAFEQLLEDVDARLFRLEGDEATVPDDDAGPPTPPTTE
jgi:CPA1 family monovalent cation:H+ antiporter